MWYINSFHIQILIIELLFCIRLPKRRWFWQRLLTASAVYLALPSVVPGGYFASFLSIGWFTFGFLVMLVLSGGLLWLCFRINVRQLIFYCCIAHTLQHMVHCLYRITCMAFPVSFAAGQIFQLLYLVVTCVIVERMLRNHFGESETVDMQNNYLLSFAMVSTLLVYGISFWASAVERETVGLHFFDFFSCLLLVIILLDLFRIRRAEREQIIMERLLRQEQEQHNISRATIDVINRKCHDLRHQIAALRHMNEEEQEKSIGELEKAVMIYDSFPKTGNKDLDIVLTEKCLLAEKQHVTVRCIVDGEKLSFMALEDMYSLMGNALDNAIEAASAEEKESRRIVTLYLAAKGNFLSIHVENPCAREPLFQDGFPITSKEDTDYHGYGMRSMCFLCEKYGGVLTTEWEDGIFLLNMLFPIAEEKTT